MRVRQFGGEGLALELASHSPYEVELFDSRGRRVAALRGDAQKLSETLDLHSLGLKNGAYAVEIRQDGLGATGNIAIAR